MEKHRANAVCASCHAKMDPLGFGLENYDGIGNGAPWTANSPSTPPAPCPTANPSARRPKCALCSFHSFPHFAHCVVEKLMTYSLGRGLSAGDRRTIDDIDKKMAEDGYRFQTLIYEIVKSLPFQSAARRSNPSAKNGKAEGDSPE